jgi:uncharacterized protein YecE (DUF72 family)
MHGSPRIYYADYGPDALVAIRRHVDAQRPDIPVWCIFDNTAAFAALGNAMIVADAVRR